MGDIREVLERSEKMLCKGIDEINDRGDLNASNLELLGEAVDALKDIYSIKEKTEEGSYERYMAYSNDGYGARQRDSRGRYRNEYGRGYEGYEARGGYRDSGYSRYGADEDSEENSDMFYPDSDELYRTVIDIFYVKEG